MKISYYNVENDDHGKKYGHFKKDKTLTIRFNQFLEMIQFENSDRGYLLWINTPNRVNVFGFWKGSNFANMKFYEHWHNDHFSCG